jgi:hypothetical protein
MILIYGADFELCWRAQSAKQATSRGPSGNVSANTGVQAASEPSLWWSFGRPAGLEEWEGAGRRLLFDSRRQVSGRDRSRPAGGDLRSRRRISRVRVEFYLDWREAVGALARRSSGPNAAARPHPSGRRRHTSTLAGLDLAGAVAPPPPVASRARPYRRSGLANKRGTQNNDIGAGIPRRPYLAAAAAALARHRLSMVTSGERGGCRGRHLWRRRRRCHGKRAGWPASKKYD